MKVTAEQLQQIMASTNSALVVVTTAHDGQADGCVVGFHSQAGMEPPRYAVWLSRVNRTYEIAVAASTLAVHFLSDTDHALAQRFGGSSGDDVDKFADLECSRGPGDVPLLQQCQHRLILERYLVIDAGDNDHICWIGTVVEAQSRGRFEPLRLSYGDDISAGHPITDRAKI